VDPVDAADPAERELGAALERARDGDEGAFLVLWRTLQPPLLRYLVVRGEEAPEDLASETWLQVVRDLPDFRGGITEFRAWLFTLARHRAIDAGRARRVRPAVVVAEPPVPGSAPSAEAETVERLSTHEALRLVATLPPGQAELVMLRVVGGLDVATVASMTGKQPGAVRVGVHRALKALARTWEVNR
jgi:RNA polymerase sigma-70 factor, ECF subfamily